jgi:hypothetical protein
MYLHEPIKYFTAENTNLSDDNLPDHNLPDHAIPL